MQTPHAVVGPTKNGSTTRKAKPLPDTSEGGLIRIAAGTIERRILFLRGHTVMLDSHLAKLYRVSTKAFNQAVKRNSERFPADFMFQLSREEAKSLRSQIVTLDDASQQPELAGRGRYSKYRPYVFTEHGIAMLSSVLRSKRAVQMNIQIIRAFIRLREMLFHHKDLALRLEKLETDHRRHATMIGFLASEILQMKKLPPGKRRYGFRVENADQSSFKTGNNAGALAASKSK